MNTLTWFGQASFVIEAQQTRIAIDPFFSQIEGRRGKAHPIDDLGDVQAVLITHEHLDHWDVPTIKRLRTNLPSLQVVLPAPLGDLARQAGFSGSEITLAHPGQRVSIGGLHVVPVLSSHAVHVQDGYGFGDPAGRFLGYCVTVGSAVLYHSGDTILYSGLSETLRKLKVQWVLLPINGRNFYREQHDIVGNLDAEEAVRLAEEIDAEAMVPMHYDAFTGNLADPSAVLYWTLQRQTRFTVLVPAYGIPIPLPERVNNKLIG